MEQNNILWIHDHACALQMYKEAQRILERQRFQFPSNWLYIDNVEGEWGAFSDIMKRKDSSIQMQVASLQMKISSEDTLVESKTGTMLQEWEKEKPVTVRHPFCSPPSECSALGKLFECVSALCSSAPVCFILVRSQLSIYLVRPVFGW